MVKVLAHDLDSIFGGPVTSTWGVAQREAKLQGVCGDSYVCLEDGDRRLWAVVDGAGHGGRAHQAATEAAEFIRANGFATGPGRLLSRLHERLKTSVGAAVSILRLDQKTGRLDFAGVGNVTLRTAGPSEIHPATSPGLLGRTMKRVNVFSFTARPGDLLVLISDGIDSGFPIVRYATLPPSEAATKIVADWHDRSDDGTCLVVRVGEAEPEPEPESES